MNLNRLLSIKKTELSISVLSFVLIMFAVLSSRTSRLTSEYAISCKEKCEFVFKEQANLEKLITELKTKGAEFNKEQLEWASGLLGWKRFQRGRYILEGDYSYNALLSKLARGIQDPVSVTILPGLTKERLIQRIAKELHFTETEMKAVLEDTVYLAEQEMSEQDLFARMLPETYLIYWTKDAEDVRKKILREFERLVVDKYANQAQELNISIDEALIMASIIEWEAANTEEKPTISGLYWNRLNRRMPLQADPTVNYVVGERRRLLFEDYQIDHPYNTYIHQGLPPGPITNPSLSSIKAALFPEEHDFLYMVASPEGGHVFSETFEQHKIESERWRKWLRQQYRIKKQQEEKAQSEKETETRL
ncbi:MAG: endolytic transglycosylase MltG [Balneolaceae bacterium]|nr:endolytic transglycosylase MltG [Balneolaceae bacterium]